MLLDEIIFESVEQYLHLERYVNVGSNSGFDIIHTTSIETSAKGDADSFTLYCLDYPENINVFEYGIKPDFFSWKMLIHPDMINEEMFKICKSIKKSNLIVSPTASSRTVKIRDENGWFIKLNYKGLLGRIDRNLGKKHASSAIEVSNIIESAIDNNLLPNFFYIMREKFARVVELFDNGKPYGWGMVLREPNVYPRNPNIKFLIPAFSLFSIDEKKVNDPTLLYQLFLKQDKQIEDFLFEDLIAPIYESYFTLILKCGLHLESHAQNTMIAIDENYKIIGIVAKDMESIDKDLTLIEELNLNISFTENSYKCISKNLGNNYYKQHSFMFDFKLGEYLITNIIENATFCVPEIDKLSLISKIKKLNNFFIEQLPSNFFLSNNKWYSDEKIVRDRTKKKEYLENFNPKYR